MLNEKGSGELIEYMYLNDKENNYYTKFITLHKEYYLYDEEIEIIKKYKEKIAEYLKESPYIVDIGPGTTSALE